MGINIGWSGNIIMWIPLTGGELLSVPFSWALRRYVWRNINYCRSIMAFIMISHYAASRGQSVVGCVTCASHLWWWVVGGRRGWNKECMLSRTSHFSCLGSYSSVSIHFPISLSGFFPNFLFPPQPLPASHTLCLPPSSSLHPTGTVDQRVLGDKYPGPRAHQPPIPATLLCHIVAEASLKRH